MQVVRCSGCTRRMGVSLAVYPMRNKVWCSAWCSKLETISQNETRDAVMTEMSRAGSSDGQIARVFGVGRSRVQQIASARRA